MSFATNIYPSSTTQQPVLFKTATSRKQRWGGNVATILQPCARFWNGWNTQLYTDGRYCTLLNWRLRPFFSWLDSPGGSGPPHRLGFEITLHSVGLLWTSNRPVAVTSTWQHTNTHSTQTHNPSKRTTADPCLRPRGHRDRSFIIF